MIAAGIWVVTPPEMSLIALTIVMAVYFIIDGISQLVYAFSLMPIRGGFYMLFGGLFSVALGALIFLGYPDSSTYFIGIYLGIKLLMDGITLALTGRSALKTTKEFEEVALQ